MSTHSDRRAERILRSTLAWTTAVALLLVGCESMPQVAALSSALVSTIGENYGGKYYAEATGFLQDLQAASAKAMAEPPTIARIKQSFTGDGQLPQSVQDQTQAAMNGGMNSGMPEAMGGQVYGGMPDATGGQVYGGMPDAMGGGMDSPMGSGMGGGMDSPMGSGMGSTMGSGMNSGMGGAMGSGMGSGMDSTMGSGMGSGMDSAMGSGMGSAMGSGMDGSMGYAANSAMASSPYGPYGFDPGAQAAQVLELQVALMKRVREGGAERIVAIANGDVLRTNPSNPDAGDQFQIFFRPNMDAYVYIVAIDATGWAQPIFPSAFPDAQNPVPANATGLIPEAGYWFGLDEYRGTQHIYFVASPHPRPDLEARMLSFATMERPTLEAPAKVGVPMVVEEAFVMERGLTGIRPGASTTYAPEVKAEVHSFGVAGADLVVTRYFESQ